MSTSEIIYYLKNGQVSKIIAGGVETPTDIDLIKIDDRYSVLIDDEYFFYMNMESIAISGKKLTNIVNNYLTSKLPAEWIKLSNYLVTGGRTLIYVASEKLEEITDTNPAFFLNAQRLSTPFIEQLTKYQEFDFDDGKRLYHVTEKDIIVTLNKVANSINAKDVITDIDKVVASMRLFNVRQRSRLSNYPFIIPLSALMFCYIIFVIGNLLSLNTLSKTEKVYNNILTSVYVAGGVKDTGDPYGMLLLKSKKGGDGFDGMKILPILKELSVMGGNDVRLKSFNYRDKSIKIEGTATDFAKLEAFQKLVTKTVGQDVTIGDTKKIADGVVFSLRYNR